MLVDTGCLFAAVQVIILFHTGSFRLTTALTLLVQPSWDDGQKRRDFMGSIAAAGTARACHHGGVVTFFMYHAFFLPLPYYGHSCLGGGRRPAANDLIPGLPRCRNGDISRAFPLFTCSCYRVW